MRSMAHVAMWALSRKPKKRMVAKVLMLIKVLGFITLTISIVIIKSHLVIKTITYIIVLYNIITN